MARRSRKRASCSPGRHAVTKGQQDEWGCPWPRSRLAKDPGRLSRLPPQCSDGAGAQWPGWAVGRGQAGTLRMWPLGCQMVLVLVGFASFLLFSSYYFGCLTESPELTILYHRSSWRNEPFAINLTVSVGMLWLEILLSSAGSEQLLWIGYFRDLKETCTWCSCL